HGHGGRRLRKIESPVILSEAKDPLSVLAAPFPIPDMTQQALHQCILRELRSLKRELDAYPDDASVWATPPGIKNPAGTLFLHLAGNLQHFVGAKLGDTGYVRNREAEFSRRGVSRAEIARELDAATAAVDAGFAKLTDRTLESEFLEQIAG